MPDPAAPRTVRVTVECVKTSHTLMGQPIAPHLTTRLCVFCGAPEFAPPGVILATLADPAAEAKLSLVDGFLAWLKSTEDEEARGLDLLRQVKRLAFPAPGQQGDR